MTSAKPFNLTFHQMAIGLTAAIAALSFVTALGTLHAAAQQGAPAEPSLTGHLLVGDTAAGKVYLYATGGNLPLVSTFDDLAIGAHAGIVALRDGRVLIPDDRNKQLVVVRIGAEAAPAIERRVPMPIPLPTRYAWAAVDPGGKIYAATGLDSDESVKILTLVDLTTYAAKQFRVDTGAADAELNLALGGDPDPIVFLHLAERVDAYRVADLMRPETKINAILDGTVKPSSTLALGKGGHSNSFSPPLSKWTGSTLRGFEIATLQAGGTLAGHKTLSWEADEGSGGRNARQRLTYDGRHAFGPLNASVPPAQWAEAQVDLHWVDLAAETARRVPLARGAVGRGGVSRSLAVYASIHPDGDHANLVDADPASPTFRQVAARVPLPKLAGGPVVGQPTAGREGRYSAITPDGRLAFVTQGGEGKIHVIDTGRKTVVRTIETPTPLKGGGYIVAIQPAVPSADLSAR
jgi:DNA-binding beta-propeller fold protein YncE